MHHNAQHRLDILRTLYAARERKPAQGWLAEHELKDAQGDPAFALDVLVELGQVKRDGYRYRITGQGVLIAEAHDAP